MKRVLSLLIMISSLGLASGAVAMGTESAHAAVANSAGFQPGSDNFQVGSDALPYCC
jgi:hypothetical protein